MSPAEAAAYRKGVDDACTALDAEYRRRKTIAGRRPDTYDEGSLHALEDAGKIVRTLTSTEDSTDLVQSMYGT